MYLSPPRVKRQREVPQGSHLVTRYTPEPPRGFISRTPCGMSWPSVVRPPIDLPRTPTP